MKDPKITAARQMLCRYLGEVAKEKGMSTYKIAEITGFNQPNVHRMLTGKYSPSIDNFMILADAIGCYFFIIDKEEDNELAEMMRKRWQRNSQVN
jgi:DNA-binding phage protein